MGKMLAHFKVQILRVKSKKVGLMQIYIYMYMKSSFLHYKPELLVESGFATINEKNNRFHGFVFLSMIL